VQFCIDDATTKMKSQLESSTQEVLAGLVERVTYHNAENGFCVCGPRRATRDERLGCNSECRPRSTNRVAAGSVSRRKWFKSTRTSPTHRMLPGLSQRLSDFAHHLTRFAASALRERSLIPPRSNANQLKVVLVKLGCAIEVVGGYGLDGDEGCD
jgi:hypothetical protein